MNSAKLHGFADLVLQAWRPLLNQRLFLLLLLLCGGCAMPSAKNRIIGPSYSPTNVNLAQKQMPPQLRRVAVLPLANRLNDSESEAGRESLQPVLLAELSKTGLLDTAFVQENDLRQWSGRAKWSAEERLPTSLLKKIREQTGADGVLFCELTTYRPYPPLSVGWRFKLVDCQEAKIWWSIDEVFDAGDPTVANAARHYYNDHMQQSIPLQDSQSILSSPRRFGQYTLHAVFSTLPSR
ncbi:MAG TPA: hypothetical protein P5186_12385 [Candidatus Paceibacterota bacterium]|nr:hypothetical protein [Verrucomicrobiota bacterium]HRY48839.1 hypothetical protein [Candidatus Paceibacterota bacterium]HSA03499.1 hypothetical protein [Candidatus Paceibacterota bacterium]